MFWSTAVCRPVRDIEVLRDLQVSVIIIIEIITIIINVIINLIIIAIASVLPLLILFSLPSPIITSSTITLHHHYHRPPLYYSRWAMVMVMKVVALEVIIDDGSEKISAKPVHMLWQ